MLSHLLVGLPEWMPELMKDCFNIYHCTFSLTFLCKCFMVQLWFCEGHMVYTCGMVYSSYLWITYDSKFLPMVWPALCSSFMITLLTYINSCICNCSSIGIVGILTYNYICDVPACSCHLYPSIVAAHLWGLWIWASQKVNVLWTIWQCYICHCDISFKLVTIFPRAIKQINNEAWNNCCHNVHVSFPWASQGWRRRQQLG